MTETDTLTRQLCGRAKVTYEEFLALTEDMHAEWVDGEILPHVTVSVPHVRLSQFLIALFRLFLDVRPLGELFSDPFQVKPGASLPGRTPDIAVLLAQHAMRRRHDHIDGPADLVIEIVSPGNERTDRVIKLAEYERGGIPEYWILDPAARTASFYVLDASGRYASREMADGIYRSHVLPDFWIRIDWFSNQPPVLGCLREMRGEEL
jgi:Uma2 family endonuclease